MIISTRCALKRRKKFEGGGAVAVLTPADVEKAFSLEEQLRNVDAVIGRVFSGSAAALTTA